MGFEQRQKDNPVTPILHGDAIWEVVPVGTDVFFRDYLKEPFFPKQQELVDAMLGTDPKEWATKFVEGIALWGKGAGKDRTAAKILTYVCYKLLCMRNPVAYFNQNTPPEYKSELEDKLEVANVCINGHLAKTVFFKYFKIMIRATKNPVTGKNWFVERGLDLRRDVLANEVNFPKNITAHSLNSEEYTGEGLNLFFVIFDEIAGFDPARARELYKALRSTCVSRFPQHYKMMLLSYKRRDEDYMMTRFHEAEKDERVFRMRAATWEVNLRRKQKDFIKEYENNPEEAQRTYECLGETSEGGYIKFKDRIREVIDLSGKQNPIVGDLTTVVNLRGIQFKDWFKPIAGIPYFAHVDLAKGQKGGDACGIALGHYRKKVIPKLSSKFIKAVQQFEGMDLSEAENSPTTGVTIDLLLQLKAVPGGEVLFDEVREFLKRLHRDQGFPLGMVTYDGWQSIDSIQLLKRDGISADIRAIDRTNEAHDTLKSQFYRGLLECYMHPIFVRETEQLIVKPNGKVDHPPGDKVWSYYEGGEVRPSKDVWDAVAGVAQTCVEKGRSEFAFWMGETRGMVAGVPKHPSRYESETLVQYGQKAPDWYKNNPT